MNVAHDEEDLALSAFKKEEEEETEENEIVEDDGEIKEPLSLKELVPDEKQLAVLLDVYPEEFIVACVDPSTKYQDQEECMKRLISWLQQANDLPKGFLIFPSITLPIEKTKVAQATYIILLRIFSSKLLKVLIPAHQALRVFLDSPILQRPGKKDEFSSFVKSLIPLLLSKTGDINPRNQKEAIRSIRRICNNKNVNMTTVLPLVLEPIKSKNAAKLWTGRLYLLEMLVKDHRMKPKGPIEADKIMPLVNEALQSINTQIRTSGINVCKQIYQDIGDSLFEYCRSVKAATLTILRSALYLSDSVTEEKQAEVPDEVPFNPVGVPKDLLLKRAQKTPRNEKETLKQYLARLTHLHLDNAGLESMENIQYCTSVRVLYLFNNKIEKITSLNVIGKNITHLYLQHNKIKKLENLESLVNLTKLYLDNNSIEVVENLETMTKLEELYLSNQELPENVCMSFDESSMKAISGNLLLLTASNCQISEVMNLGWLECLTKLHLSKNRIDNLEAVHFVLSSNTYLTELDISQNPINKIPKYRDKIIVASRRNLEQLDGISIGSNERQFVQTMEVKRKAGSQKSTPETTPRIVHNPPLIQPTTSRPQQNAIPLRSNAKKPTVPKQTVVVDMTSGLLTVTPVTSNKKDTKENE